MHDLRHMPDLSTSTVSVTPAVPLTEVGQRFEQVVRLAGRSFSSTWTLVELEPGHRLRVEGQLMRGVRYGIAQAVTALDDETSRLTFKMTYELPLGLLGRLVGRPGAERRALSEAAEVMGGIKRLAAEIGRAHVCTPDTNADRVSRLL